MFYLKSLRSANNLHPITTGAGEESARAVKMLYAAQKLLARMSSNFIFSRFLFI